MNLKLFIPRNKIPYWKCTVDPLLEIYSIILKEQLQDKKLTKIYRTLVNNIKNAFTKGYAIDNNTKLLMYHHFSKYSPQLKIILPVSLGYKALKIAHIGHPGVKRTFQSIQL